MLLGVHYPSDVTAGVALGAGLALASYAGWRPTLPQLAAESAAQSAAQPAAQSARK